MPSDTLSPAGERLRALPVQQDNLVSDGFVPAAHTDPNLVNPWGVSYGATGPFWVSNAGTGTTTIYNGAGEVFPVAGQNVITVTAPPGFPIHSLPTGQVNNPGGTGFTISEGGVSASPAFLFADIAGSISGWSPTVAAGHTVVAVDNSASGAIYTGLALGTTPEGKLLYAANFHSGEVEVYDQGFHRVNTVTDPFIPSDYAPFNVQVLAGKLYVAYAQQDAAEQRDVPGEGHGYVDVFDLSGTLLQRVASNGLLDSPWGLDLAPASFGEFAGDLLVGNFGDGTINVYDSTTNALVGQLSGLDGNPLVNDDLWALVNGNGASAGDTQKVYFTAGIDEEQHGLFGSLTPVPQTPSGEVDWNALSAQVQANFVATGHWFV